MHDQDNLIEKKLDGTLNVDETRRFDHLLRADPAFAQAYTTQREMIDLFRQHNKEVLHEQLKAGYQVYQKEKASRKYYYGIAAVLFIAVLGGGWFWWIDSSQSLFEKYYHPYETTSPRGEMSSPNDQAVYYYSQEQYAKALPLLQALQETSNSPDYWIILLGNAYLQLDSTAQAATQFQQAGNSQNVVYRQYGNWYLALSYLKDKNVLAAQKTLQSIADQPGLFQKKAKQLLDEL